MTIDTIKAKTFFKILESGDFIHYSRNKEKQLQLSEVWKGLVLDYEKESKDKKRDKKLNLDIQINSIYSKYQAINLACDALSFQNDDDAKNILKEFYIKVDENTYHQSLATIKNENKSYLVQIEKFKRELPKPSEEKEISVIAFDANVLGYANFVGASHLRPNNIILSEYLWLLKTGQEKLKQLETTKTKSNGN